VCFFSPRVSLFILCYLGFFGVLSRLLRVVWKDSSRRVAERKLYALTHLYSLDTIGTEYHLYRSVYITTNFEL